MGGDAILRLCQKFMDELAKNPTTGSWCDSTPRS